MRVVVGRLLPIEQSDSRPLLSLPHPPSLPSRSSRQAKTHTRRPRPPPRLRLSSRVGQAIKQPFDSQGPPNTHASSSERPATVPSSSNPPSPSSPPIPFQPTSQSRTTLLHSMSSSIRSALKTATLAATVLSAAGTSTVRAAQEPGTFEIVGNSGVSAQQVRFRLSPSLFQSSLSLSCLCCSRGVGVLNERRA